MNYTGKYSTPLRTWFDWHPDRIPNDFGVPERPYLTKEEYEAKVAAGEMRPMSEWDIMRDDECDIDNYQF